MPQRAGVAVALAGVEELAGGFVGPVLVGPQGVGRELGEDLVGDHPGRAVLLAVEGDEVVGRLVEDALQFVGGVGGLAGEELLIGLGEPLAGLGRVAAEAGRLGRGRRLGEGGRPECDEQAGGEAGPGHGAGPSRLGAYRHS